MTVGYDRNDWFDFGLKIPVKITLGENFSSLLITGKSGSGKSCSLKLYMRALLERDESYIFLSDYKAGREYLSMRGCPYYAYGDEAIEAIRKFYCFFTKIRSEMIELDKHVTLIIEEYFGLLAYLEARSKKEKTEIQNMVAEMLAVSRGLNIGIWVCVQRADASHFVSGSRDQFQGVLTFGRCSAEHFRMLGFAGELDTNPTGSFSAGQGLFLCDGQDEVRSIIVPKITSIDQLNKELRTLMDMQGNFLSL